VFIISDKYQYQIDGEIVYLHIKNRKGQIWTVLIDKDDLEKVINYKYKWCPLYNKWLDDYYMRATRYDGIHNGKPIYTTVLLHQFIMNVEGSIHVDHINNNPRDNRKQNLRIISKSDNAINRKGLNTNNVSGERNVSWSETTKKWIVQLQVNGKNKCFGRFKENELDEAIKLAREKRKEIYGQ
jgi:hypothetical protein